MFSIASRISASSRRRNRGIHTCIMAGLRFYVGSLPYVAQKLEIEQLFVDNDLPM